MDQREQPGSAFNELHQPDSELYLDCVHCGFCLPSCPTYVVLGNEMDNPRGRIYLIRAASEGKIKITDSFVKHMDLCLLCRNCETACPSGVKFGFLMEAARGQIERQYKYSLRDRWFRELILRTFTHMGTLKTMSRLLRFYQRFGLQKIVRFSQVLSLLGRLGKMEAFLPTVPRAREDLAEVMPAKGESRGRVGLLLGCVQRYFFPQVNVATARALNEFGYDVVVPKEQGCCGSLLVHEGARERAKVLARKTIDVFERAGVDMIAVNAAGCGSVMKEYWELFHSDGTYAHRAEAFSKKVRDVSQILAQQPMKGGLGAINLTATYHDACHLAHGQKIRQEPRALLQAIPGLRLVELKESDFCCGSAGIYNLLHPELAQEFLHRKIERIKETGAQVVVSGNPGCSLQIEKGLKDQGINIPVVHPVELIDWSTRGKER